MDFEGELKYLTKKANALLIEIEYLNTRIDKIKTKQKIEANKCKN